MLDKMRHLLVICLLEIDGILLINYNIIFYVVDYANAKL
jgi:hypothetical protein